MEKDLMELKKEKVVDTHSPHLMTIESIEVYAYLLEVHCDESVICPT